MAKKKSDKETEPKKVSTKRFSAFLKNETTHFVIGLISVIFAVYLLLAFTSFFFTGAADQSILDNQQPGELMQTANHVKNYAGARGAQLAEFLINECFGLAAYFIILFLAVVGMKLMKAYQFRIWKWFMSCSILLIWFSITLGFIFDGTFGDSFIYPGGLHGHAAPGRAECPTAGAPGAPRPGSRRCLPCRSCPAAHRPASGPSRRPLPAIPAGRWSARSCGPL